MSSNNSLSSWPRWAPIKVYHPDLDELRRRVAGPGGSDWTSGGRVCTVRGACTHKNTWNRGTHQNTDTDPTFQIVADPTWIFSSIFNINFAFVSSSCLDSVLRCIVRRDISFSMGSFFKGILYFLNWSFCLEIVKFYQFFFVGVSLKGGIHV